MFKASADVIMTAIPSSLLARVCGGRQPRSTNARSTFTSDAYARRSRAAANATPSEPSAERPTPSTKPSERLATILGALLWRLAQSPIRANDPRRISADKTIRGNVLGDDRTCRDDGMLADRHATDDDGAGCDPHAFLDHDGLSNSGGASLRGFEGMAGRDDADVRPDHHIVRDIEVAQVIKSTVLIDEDVTPDTDFVAVGA